MSRRALWWAVSLVGVAAWVSLAAWGASSGAPTVCLFRRTLELPCPGCGLTRAFSLLARGDLLGALTLHPLAPLLLLEAFAAWGLWGLWAHDRLPARLGRFLTRRRGELLVGTGLLLLALWVGRLAAGDLSAL